MNFRALFSTPKKAAAVIICLLAAVAAVGIGLAYALRANVRPLDEETVIGSENARNYAFADAGVDPASAQAVHVVYERFEEYFVYSVEFIAEDTQYAYKINAADGSVVRKESRTAAEPGSTMPLLAVITLEDAQEIALTDAGVSREEAIFSKAEAGTQGGLSVYRFKFYAANMEYEYEINAGTGAVYSKKTVAYLGQNPGAAPSAAPRPSAPAQTAAPAVRPDVTAEPAQSPAGERPDPTDSVTPAPSASQPANRMYIGMNAAKNAAVADAGADADQVRFTKMRMDYKDGLAVYELEFYTATHRYEYRIDARTGAVYSRKAEPRSD